MIFLNNGCARSQIKVTPANWDIKKPSKKVQAELLQKEWKIYYRYYDPVFKDDPLLWGKQIQLRAGINEVADFIQRQMGTRTALESIHDLIDNRLYNPITCKYYVQPEQIEEVAPVTPFIDALWKAHAMLKGVKDMLDDIKSVIRGVSDAASKLYDKEQMKPYSALKISQVTRKHIVYIFRQCAKDNPKFSNNRQNKYRAYLLMLFKELLKVEAIEYNPVKDIPVEKGGVKKLREILTPTESMLIDVNVKAWNYNYWRYIRIFFRSGSRSTEMAALKPEHVYLEQQEFKVLVKKRRRQYEWQIRPIPRDVLRLWIEVMEEAKTGEFLFGALFKPGKKPLALKLINTYWLKYVKGHANEWQDQTKRRTNCLYINKDFYLLKHTNEDTIAKEIDLQHAAAAAGHASTMTTERHYALGHKKRELEKLKDFEIKTHFKPLE
jgi:site-specific recombinase XerC